MNQNQVIDGYSSYLQDELFSNSKKAITLYCLLNNKVYSSTTFVVDLMGDKPYIDFICNFLEVSYYSFIEFYSYQYPTAARSKKIRK